MCYLLIKTASVQCNTGALDHSIHGLQMANGSVIAQYGGYHLLWQPATVFIRVHRTTGAEHEQARHMIVSTIRLVYANAAQKN